MLESSSPEKQNGLYIQAHLGDVMSLVPDDSQERESNEFFGILVHIKVTFILSCSLLSVQ